MSEFKQLKLLSSVKKNIAGKNHVIYKEEWYTFLYNIQNWIDLLLTTNYNCSVFRGLT